MKSSRYSAKNKKGSCLEKNYEKNIHKHLHFLAHGLKFFFFGSTVRGHLN
jgi:hypothetical protein